MYRQKCCKQAIQDNVGRYCPICRTPILDFNSYIKYDYIERTLLEHIGGTCDSSSYEFEEALDFNIYALKNIYYE